MIEILRAVGCPDPENWARDQFRDHRPQLSRFLLLRRFWTATINPWRDSLLWIDNLIADSNDNPAGPFAGAGQALERMVLDGADRADIAELARFIAYESVFSAVHTLDDGFDTENEGELPGWAVVERVPLGEVTDSVLVGLHDELPALEKT